MPCPQVEEAFHVTSERRLVSAQIATSMKETSVVGTQRHVSVSLPLTTGSSSAAWACQAVLDNLSHWCPGDFDLLTIRANVRAHSDRLGAIFKGFLMVSAGQHQCVLCS